MPHQQSIWSRDLVPPRWRRLANRVGFVFAFVMLAFWGYVLLGSAYYDIYRIYREPSRFGWPAAIWFFLVALFFWASVREVRELLKRRRGGA
jgi:hypothetical protein